MNGVACCFLGAPRGSGQLPRAATPSMSVRQVAGFAQAVDGIRNNFGSMFRLICAGAPARCGVWKRLHLRLFLHATEQYDAFAMHPQRAFQRAFQFLVLCCDKCLGSECVADLTTEPRNPFFSNFVKNAAT